MPITSTPLIALLVRNVNFGIFTAGNTVSLIGMWMERIAVGWLTWQLTESGFWLGVVAFADFFPVVVIAPFAGAVADRFDRLRVVKISQSLLLVQALVLFALTASGTSMSHGSWRSPPFTASWWRSTSRRGSRSFPRWCRAPT